MSLPRFFLQNQVLASEQDSVFALELSADDVKHARVLRLSSGEHIAVIDADQDYFECEIISFDSHCLEVTIAKKCEESPRMPNITLLQGLAKADKVDSVIRHATEIGVTRFIPLACARSVLKLDGAKQAKRLERWRAIAKSAAMQAGCDRIPVVEPVATGKQAVSLLNDMTCVLVCWEEATAGSIHEALQTALHEQNVLPEDAQVAVVVGPEGGLTAEEVDAFLASNEYAYTVTLGRTILRTETAGVVGPALTLYELGALQ